MENNFKTVSKSLKHWIIKSIINFRFNEFSKINKGQEIAIEGKISYRNWEDKNGNKRVATEIICSELLMVGGK